MTALADRGELLQRLLEEAGVEWALRPDRSGTIARMLTSLSDLEHELEGRLGLPSAPNVLQEAERDPISFRPLLQSFASPLTTPVRAAVYVLVSGGELRRLHYEYDRDQRSSRLHIVVATHDGRPLECRSSEVWDVDFVRHLGLMKAGDRPIIDGYYAFAR